MKQILTDGDEYDCVSKRCRRCTEKRAGHWKKIKRKMNKRFRKQCKQQDRTEVDND